MKPTKAANCWSPNLLKMNSCITIIQINIKIMQLKYILVPIKIESSYSSLIFIINLCKYIYIHIYMVAYLNSTKKSVY